MIGHLPTWTEHAYIELNIESSRLLFLELSLHNFFNSADQNPC